MATVNHVVDPNHGPVVEITIGLSFAQEQRRSRRGGISPPPRKTVWAAIHTGLSTTLVGEQLRLEIDPAQCDLHYQLRIQDVPLLGVEQRAETQLYVALPELAPVFKSVETIIAPLSGPIQCFLGRNYLRVAALTLTYFGDQEVFSLGTDGIE